MHSLNVVRFCARVATLFLLTLGGAYAAGSCDRACLRTTAERYLAALVEHAPAKAGLASNIRYTENAVDVKPGQGLWQTATGLGKLIRIYVDAQQSQAGIFGLIDEGSVPAIVSIRLKVANGKISEAEAIIGRKGISLHDPETLLANPPSDRPVDASLRSSREQMVAAAASYFDGAQTQNPKIVLQKPGCNRFENGVKMTNRAGAGPGGVSMNRDCAGTLENSKQIAAVVNRRYPVVDEEAGVVMAYGVFNRPPGAKRSDGTLWPKLLLTEFFPVEQGRFTSIYAAMFYLPPDIQDSGWHE